MAVQIYSPVHYHCGWPFSIVICRETADDRDARRSVGAQEGVGSLLPLGSLHAKHTRQWQKAPDTVEARLT